MGWLCFVTVATTNILYLAELSTAAKQLTRAECSYVLLQWPEPPSPFPSVYPLSFATLVYTSFPREISLGPTWLDQISPSWTS